MDNKINLAEKLALLDKPYAPAIVGYLNDYKLQIVKVKGPFVWHKLASNDAPSVHGKQAPPVRRSDR